MPNRFAVAAVLAGSLVIATAAAAVRAESPSPESATARRGEAYFHLMKARLAAGEGRLSEALGELRAAVDASPDSSELHAEASAMLLHLGRQAEAEREAKRALAIDPKESTALRVSADLAARRALGPEGDAAAREEAIRLYGQLAREPGADEDIFPILARLRSMSGDNAGAVEAARAFAERRPGDSAAARLMAQYLERAGKKEEALDVLARFFSENPDAEEILLPLGDLARETNRWEPVVAACSRALEALPDRPAARALRGEAYLRLGREREAVGDFEKVREAAPDNRLALFQLATAYGEVGRLAAAAEIALRLSSDMPEHAGIQSFLGEILGRQGDLEAAVAAFRSALGRMAADGPEAAPKRDGIRRRLVSLYLARSRVADAARVAAEIEDKGAPESLEVAARLALAEKQGAAARELAKQMRNAGEPGIAAIVEADSFLLEGKIDRARARYEEATAVVGPGAWADAAEAFRAAGRAAEGQSLLKAWVKREPANVEARFRLGSFLERERLYPEAETELREVIRIAPNHAIALNYLGYSLADRGVSLDEALALIRRALALEPWNGAYLDSLGWALYRLGRFAEAREPIERAARDHPFDPTVLEHLGDVYDKLGEAERARVSWRRALDAGSERADALRSKLEASDANGTAPGPSDGDGRRADGGPSPSIPR